MGKNQENNIIETLAKIAQIILDLSLAGFFVWFIFNWQDLLAIISNL